MWKNKCYDREKWKAQDYIIEKVYEVGECQRDFYWQTFVRQYNIKNNIKINAKGCIWWIRNEKFREWILEKEYEVEQLNYQKDNFTYQEGLDWCKRNFISRQGMNKKLGACICL